MATFVSHHKSKIGKAHAGRTPGAPRGAGG
ncbi:hypothetical protein J3R08_005142 [Micromonospora sp. HB375]|nr:hypothetical protein [Micromonospora sp. HB375]MDH6467707.1 hypothetical protein [Micromonospora sp. H404/HB375]